jgi:hypothetical protein
MIRAMVMRTARRLVLKLTAGYPYLARFNAARHRRARQAELEPHPGMVRAEIRRRKPAAKPSLPGHRGF